MPFVVKDEVAIITGSAQGFGKEFAKRLLKQEAKVCLSDVNAEEGEKTLVELLVESSSHGQALQIMSSHQVDPEKDEIPWADLIDNRDFKVMVSWDPQEK